MHQNLVSSGQNSDFSKFWFWPELVKNVQLEPELFDKIVIRTIVHSNNNTSPFSKIDFMVYMNTTVKNKL